jgi:hypothetical protein
MGRLERDRGVAWMLAYKRNMYYSPLEKRAWRAGWSRWLPAKRLPSIARADRSPTSPPSPGPPPPEAQPSDLIARALAHRTWWAEETEREQLSALYRNPAVREWVLEQAVEQAGLRPDPPAPGSS